MSLASSMHFSGNHGHIHFDALDDATDRFTSSREGIVADDPKYRKFLEKGPMTMEDFFLKAVELGVVGIEVTTYYLKSTEPAYLAGLRAIVIAEAQALDLGEERVAQVVGDSL